jgi:hypothetical protein
MRVPLEEAEQVLQLYREKYFDLNVRHFHEKLREGHGIRLSYTWVKLALQGAGLVKKGRKRGVHRKRRPRRALPECCCICTGAGTRGFRSSAGMTGSKGWMMAPARPMTRSGWKKHGRAR